MQSTRFRKLFGLVLALLVALLSACAQEAIAIDPVGLGPAPRLENGRFINPVGPLSHSGFGVRFPFFLRRIAGSFRERPGAPTRADNDGAFLRENARHSVPTVTWIGHATILVQMDHLTFLTDPTWSKTASPVSFMGPRRFVEPGVAFEDLPPIDFVVVSHNHYDHMDLDTLARLAERDPETRFFVPVGNAALLRESGVERVEELDWGDAVQHEGVTVRCLPAQHWSKRGLADDQKALWSSWAVVGEERRFFFAGDTGYFDGFARIGEALGPFDLVAMPIGAYAPRAMMKASHMNPEESVQASVDLRAERALAMHYGTFDLSDEPLDEPPRRFLDAVRASALAEDAGWVLEIGETRPF